MDTQNTCTYAKTNHGRNVRRLREILGVKQEAIAVALGVTQQAVSHIEQQETISDEILEKIAAVLHVPVESVKHFSEEATINIVTNTFNNEQNSIGLTSNCHLTFNPIEKMAELYEQMLTREREKVAELEKKLGIK